MVNGCGCGSVGAFAVRAPLSGRLRPHNPRPLAVEPLIDPLLSTIAAYPYRIYPDLECPNRA